MQAVQRSTLDPTPLDPSAWHTFLASMVSLLPCGSAPTTAACEHEHVRQHSPVPSPSHKQQNNVDLRHTERVCTYATPVPTTHRLLCTSDGDGFSATWLTGRTGMLDLCCCLDGESMTFISVFTLLLYALSPSGVRLCCTFYCCQQVEGVADLQAHRPAELTE